MDLSARHSPAPQLLRHGAVLLFLVLWQVSPQGQMPGEDRVSSATRSEAIRETPAAYPATATPKPAVTLTGSLGSVRTPASRDTSAEGILPEDSGRGGLNLGGIIGWTLGGVILVLLLLWGRSILMRLERRKRYQEAAQMDEQPTVDERLLSELTTMPVMLLRGSVPAYYEKIMALVRRLLLSRQILTESDSDPESIMQRLRTTGADPVFTDCVESIVHRCETVFRGERPDQAAHEKIAKDLKMLVSMRPHGGYGRKDKHPDAAPDPHKPSH